MEHVERRNPFSHPCQHQACIDPGTCEICGQSAVPNTVMEKPVGRQAVCTAVLS